MFKVKANFGCCPLVTTVGGNLNHTKTVNYKYSEFVCNDEEETFEQYNPDFCEDSHFQNALVGVAQMISLNNEVIIQNFVAIDPKFYCFMEWPEFIPTLKSSTIHSFLNFDNMPRILLKFFRSIFWNIRYKDQNPNNVMIKLIEGKKIFPLCVF